MQSRVKKLVLLLLAVLAAAAVVLWMLYDRQDVFQGEQVKTSDEYTLEFTKMNQTDSHVLSLQADDELLVEIRARKGTVDLSIGIDGKDPVYRGNRLSGGGFQVAILEAGDYRVTVKARHAEGRISVIRDAR